VVPVNIELMDDERLLALAHQHQDLLLGLPVGAAFQAITTIYPATRAPAWEALRAGLPEHAAFRAQRQAMAAGLRHRTGAMHGRLRDLTTLVTLRLPLTGLEPSLGGLLKTLLSLPRSYGHACAAPIAAAVREALDTFQDYRATFEDALRNLGHRVTPLDSQGLGQAVARALDPMGVLEPVVILPEQPLGEQVLSLEAENMPGGFRFGQTQPATGAFAEAYRCQVLSLHRVTQQTYPGMLSAPRAPKGTQPMSLWDTWDQPLSLVVNASVADQTAEENRLELKGRLAQWQAKLMTQNKTIYAQIEALKEKRLLSGTHMGIGRVHLVLWGQERTLQRGLARAINAAKRLRMVFHPEPVIGDTLFLQTLPLGCDPDFPTERALARTRRMELPNLMDMLPLYGGVQGTKTPAIMYLNQCGQFVGFSPKDKPTNPHIIVNGNSGGGKTYSMGYYLHQILALGAVAVALDPLRNYRGLCEYWDGEHVCLNLNAPLYINPFYGPLDSTHQGFLTAVLAEMASGGLDRLTHLEFNVLASAVVYFAHNWDLAGRGEPILSDFVREVLNDGCFNTDSEEARALGKVLALKLSLYYGTGLYACFVDGQNSFTLTKPFTLIEFADLETADDLKGVLFFSLFHLITQRFESAALAGIWKTLVADELWRFLRHKATADIFEKIIRTYRNIDASAMFASQRVEDYDSEIGRIICDIADTTLSLKPGPGELPKLKKIFNLTEAEEEAFQYVDKHQGWSSALLRLERGDGGIVRIIPDPLVDLLLSQSAEQVARRATLRAQYGRLSPDLPEDAYVQ
jgi:hypothetical protein